MASIESLLEHIDKGEPSTDDCGRGMHLCFRNAESLIADAETLKASNSPRAISLGILALEEIGKILLLCYAAAEFKVKPRFWTNLKRKAFGSHRHKQKLIAGYGSALLNSISKNGTPYYKVDIPAEVIPLLDRIKQWGLYVDFVAGEFQHPQNFVNENRQWVEWVIAAAKERLESIRPMHDSEEMSKWIARTTGAMSEMVRDTESFDDFIARLEELQRGQK